MKPRIFFITSYIGILRYYEKLIPYLKEYEVCFLLSNTSEQLLPPLLSYIKERNYRYYILSDYEEELIRIPFISPLWKKIKYRNRCREFLQSERPIKIIAPHNEVFRTMVLFKEANRRNIDTMVLQWALVQTQEIMESITASKNKKKDSFLERMYFVIVDILTSILNIWRRKSSLFSASQEARRVGVMDEKAVESFVGLRTDPKRIEIVGHIDNEIVHTLRKKVTHNRNKKNEMLESYGILLDRLNILVISTAFHHKDTRSLTYEEQIAYYRNIFECIREVFTEDEANIIFKLHPSEPQIFDSCRSLGVTICTEDTKTEELVALSDLYIAHPVTTVNNMARAIDVPALFVNFRSFPFLDACAPYYDIRHIIKANDDFKQKLFEFKEGRLAKQYDRKDINVTSISTIVNFITK